MAKTGRRKVKLRLVGPSETRNPAPAPAPASPSEEDESTRRAKYDYLYPSLDDPEFNVKLAGRTEFYDTRYVGGVEPAEEAAKRLCSASFELSPHQQFVRNFMSFQTPYNGLLLYHGLGSGKTCSAIGVSEEMRAYLSQMGITQRIIIVASPNVQANFKLQLFDEAKLVQRDGLWDIRSCTGTGFLREINPLNLQGLTRAKVASQVDRIISAAYLFIGYVEFANYIRKQYAREGEDAERSERLAAARLKRKFDNRLIIIDEIHNIRVQDDNRHKVVAVELLKLVRSVHNLRLLLLSATPMYNNYQEIVWLLNLLHENDARPPFELRDAFTATGDIKAGGEDLLVRKATGYVSFVRGENPYTFPYRIWPNTFAPEHTFASHAPPRIQINGLPIDQKLEHVNLYLVEPTADQNKCYAYILGKLRLDAHSGRSASAEPGTHGALGYTTLQRPLEALNIAYPAPGMEDGSATIKSLVGKEGLSRVVSFTEVANPPELRDFTYNDGFGGYFSQDNLPLRSTKLSGIVRNAINAQGVVLVHSQYIDGGVIPLALALEEAGFQRAGSGRSLFKRAPSERRMLPIAGPAGGESSPASYVMITGHRGISPDNSVDLRVVTAPENRYGAQAKVVIISRAGSEGIDFKFIRQVHIMEPWYNMNRAEQVIGRGVRHCSHRDLPFAERNVEIYLYGSLLEDRVQEAADVYVYRFAEQKAIQIGRVSRLLKQSSADCLLNIEQMGFTVEKMDQVVKQLLSSGKTIDYEVGDRPHTSACDYMASCEYACSPSGPIPATREETTLDTYAAPYALLNSDAVTARVREAFRERHFYYKPDLVIRINVAKAYPITQIDAVLDQLVGDSSEVIIDKYGRPGELRNVGSLYVFQPQELGERTLSVFDRSVPLDFKRPFVAFSAPAADSPGESAPAQRDSSRAETSDTGAELSAELAAGFDEAMSSSTAIPGRLETGWFAHARASVQAMENKGVDRAMLAQYVAAHAVEALGPKETALLLAYLSGAGVASTRSAFEIAAMDHYSRSYLEAAPGKGLMVQARGVRTLLVLPAGGGWRVATPEDEFEFRGAVDGRAADFLPPGEKLAGVVGFLGSFKSGAVVFKVKDMLKLRHRGARCDQAGRGEALRILHLVDGADQFLPRGRPTHRAICALQELVLRYYDQERHAGKRWFLGPAEALLVGIERLQR